MSFDPPRMAPDLGYAPLLHTTFPIQLILMLCSLRCLRDPRRPTLHCDSGPFTATRDPAPSTNKTHRSMANYREPIQSTSRPRNPTRLTIHLRNLRLVNGKSTRELNMRAIRSPKNVRDPNVVHLNTRTIQPPKLTCKTQTVCIQHLQRLNSIPNAASRRLMLHDFPSKL